MRVGKYKSFLATPTPLSEYFVGGEEIEREGRNRYIDIESG
jgi:hypothetical protein